MTQLLNNLLKKICYLLRQRLLIRFDTLLFVITFFICVLVFWGTWNIFSCLNLEVTTVDEPCLTPVVNSNWQLILQLISRASKLLVTEGLQHEPDLTKRSFYWVLSGGAYWENRVPCMPHWLMVILVWEHGLVETKCRYA